MKAEMVEMSRQAWGERAGRGSCVDAWNRKTLRAASLGVGGGGEGAVVGKIKSITSSLPPLLPPFRLIFSLLPTHKHAHMHLHRIQKQLVESIEGLMRGQLERLKQSVMAAVEAQLSVSGEEEWGHGSLSS